MKRAKTIKVATPFKLGKRGRFDVAQVSKSKNQKVGSLPFTMGEIIKLCKQWRKDGVLDPLERKPNPEIFRSPKCCEYHENMSHPTAECRKLKWLIDSKIKAGELLIEGMTKDLGNTHSRRMTRTMKGTRTKAKR